jgi:hypothetical protein
MAKRQSKVVVFLGPATLQYPYAIEHEGCLFIGFSRNKTAIEIVRVRIEDLAAK